MGKRYDQALDVETELPAEEPVAVEATSPVPVQVTEFAPVPLPNEPPGPDTVVERTIAGAEAQYTEEITGPHASMPGYCWNYLVTPLGDIAIKERFPSTLVKGVSDAGDALNLYYQRRGRSSHRLNARAVRVVD